MKYLYMAVTADKLELPIAVEEKSIDLARAINTNYYTVRTAMRTGKRIMRANCKCIRIEV